MECVLLLVVGVCVCVSVGQLKGLKRASEDVWTPHCRHILHTKRPRECLKCVYTLFLSDFDSGLVVCSPPTPVHPTRASLHGLIDSL